MIKCPLCNGLLLYNKFILVQLIHKQKDLFCIQNRLFMKHLQSKTWLLPVTEFFEARQGFYN
jgi:hypothetical protein